jgi:hypothetical protein
MISLILLISASVISPALQTSACHTIPLVLVDLSGLEDLDGKPSANTLDDSDGEWHLLLAIHISVLDSLNESEVFFVSK